MVHTQRTNKASIGDTGEDFSTPTKQQPWKWDLITIENNKTTEVHKYEWNINSQWFLEHIFGFIWNTLIQNR